MEVEVEILDVTEEEARTLLLSIDPLAALADTQAQLHQRRHGVIGAQDRVGQLEQGVRPPVQALIQRLPEHAQPLQRPVARHRVREDRRVRRAAGR